MTPRPRWTSIQMTTMEAVQAAQPQPLLALDRRRTRTRWKANMWTRTTAISKAWAIPLKNFTEPRASLDNLPEIERENILASRQEEIQKFKDSMALDAMFRAANDDADDDDAPSRKRRE